MKRENLYQVYKKGSRIEVNNIYIGFDNIWWSQREGLQGLVRLKSNCWKAKSLWGSIVVGSFLIDSC